MKVLEGKLVAKGMKVGIVVARFNEFIVSKLLSGALDGLRRHDVKEDDISVAWVPGAFEIPIAAQKMAGSGKYDAVICLGTVIRGFILCVGGLCSGAPPATMTMCAMRYPRGLLTCLWKVKFLYCSVY